MNNLKIVFKQRYVRFLYIQNHYKLDTVSAFSVSTNSRIFSLKFHILCYISDTGAGIYFITVFRSATPRCIPTIKAKVLLGRTLVLNLKCSYVSNSCCYFLSYLYAPSLLIILIE